MSNTLQTRKANLIMIVSVMALGRQEFYWMNKYYCPVNWENCYFPWQFRDQDYKKQHKLLT